MSWNDLLTHEPVPRGVEEKKCKICEGPIEDNPLHGADQLARMGDEKAVALRAEWYAAQRSMRESIRALARVRVPEYPQGVQINPAAIEHERLKWQVEALLSGILEPTQRFAIENEFMIKEAEELKRMLDSVNAPAAQLTTPQGRHLFVANKNWSPPRG